MPLYIINTGNKLPVGIIMPGGVITDKCKVAWGKHASWASYNSLNSLLNNLTNTGMSINGIPMYKVIHSEFTLTIT